MDQRGLIGNGYRSRQIVERSISWNGPASHYRTRIKFHALVRKLAKKGLPTDHGKSMGVLSLTMRGVAHVAAYLKGNPGALDSLDSILEGRAGRRPSP